MSRAARLPGPVPRRRSRAGGCDELDPSTAQEAVDRDARLRAALDRRPRWSEGPPTGEWRAAGLCNGLDPELFFPLPADDPAPVLQICRSCPVQGQCLATALELGEVEGVWGATTDVDRRWMGSVWMALRVGC